MRIDNEFASNSFYTIPEDIQLTIKEQQEFHIALLDAFPSREELAIMTYYGLGENLGAIVKEGPLEIMVFDLIMWAKAHNKVTGLLRGALKRNFGNHWLQAFVERLQHRQTRFRLLQLLDNNPAPSEVRSLLATLPNTVFTNLGWGRYPKVKWAVTLGSVTIDLCLGTFLSTPERWHWSLVVLASSSGALFSGPAEPNESISLSVSQLQDLRTWLLYNMKVARQQLADIRVTFDGIVLAGRRDHLSSTDRAYLSEYNDMQVGLCVRTYDWLVDALSD